MGAIYITKRLFVDATRQIMSFKSLLRRVSGILGDSMSIWKNSRRSLDRGYGTVADVWREVYP